MVCTGVILRIKLKYMKLIIYISTTKYHSALRSILKQGQGAKIALCILKLNNTQAIEKYLNGENVIYEVYKEENDLKLPSVGFKEPRKA
jgi:hypothetical protein